MKIQPFIVAIIVLIVCSQSVCAQVDSLFKKTDTISVVVEKPHSPTKATLLSTFLPGAGQVYNKKIWKVPIIYAGIGTSVFFAVSNNKSFKKFKTAYGLRIDGDDNTIDDYVDVLSDEGLRSNMDFHQRNRDLSYIVAGLFYVLNIVDAAVDAHLFNFPKNDNLSFNLQPTWEVTADNQLSSGFKLVIKL